MNNNIRRKMEKIYKRPIENIYSHRFYNDLFSGYEYSLSKERFSGRDFYKFIPDDKEIAELFGDGRHYDFSYEFGKSINRVLYSMAVYGKSYFFIHPEYVEKKDDEGRRYKILSVIHMEEVKGISKKNKFYAKTFSNEISELSMADGTLITFDLKDFGYRRNYFKKLVKRLGKCDATSISLELINNEPSYDFSVHVDKNRKRFLRKVKDIGWNFGTEDLSDSYILYKEIRMKMFKMKMLQQIIDKINQVITTEYIRNKDFKIVASINNIDYEDAWAKFQRGELTVSELGNIVWKGIEG